MRRNTEAGHCALPFFLFAERAEMYSYSLYVNNILTVTSMSGSDAFATQQILEHEFFVTVAIVLDKE